MNIFLLSFCHNHLEVFPVKLLTLLAESENSKYFGNLQGEWFILEAVFIF
jgi:hypothetical protein